MATHAGKEGLVQIGANTVAEVTDWSIEESMNPIDDTELSDTARTHKAGTTTWTGNLTCHRDETDTNGQGALTIGASVTFNLYPEGNTSGDTYKTGTASVTKIGLSTAIDGLVEVTFEFLGNRALSESTVT